jgi:membrane protease YdiL (CAAX protease family)
VSDGREGAPGSGGRIPHPVELGGGRRRRGVVAYLALAFGLAWVPFLAIPLGLGAGAPLLMPWAPALACVVVRRWVTREGFGDAGLRPNLGRWPLYLAALAWPLAANPLRVALALAFHSAPPGFAFPWGLGAPAPRDLLAWALMSVAAAPILFGEELGWRGYLQIRLLAGRPLAAAAATGVLWGVWHYPLALTGGGPVAAVAPSLLLFPLVTTVSSVFLGWLRRRSGSVWAPSVAHAGNNGLADNLVRLGFTGSVVGPLPMSAMAPALVAEVILFAAIVAGDRLLGRRGEAG